MTENGRKSSTGGRKLSICSEDEKVGIPASVCACCMCEQQRLICIRKRLLVIEDIAHKRMVHCTNAVELRNIGIYLYKIRCKWENVIGNKNRKWVGGVEL
jgi:hypothetical protein